MPTLAEKIEEASRAFAADITALVSETLLGAFALKPPTTRRWLPQLIPTKPRPGPKPKAGAKRSPEHLAALIADVGTFITSNPGRSIEGIGKGMRRETRELVLPIKKLIADGAVTTKGYKRARKYFPRAAG